MKKIININNKRLTFPSLDMSIEPNEIKLVSDSVFNCLSQNKWIKEVVPESHKTENEEPKIKDKKGRKNIK